MPPDLIQIEYKILYNRKLASLEGKIMAAVSVAIDIGTLIITHPGIHNGSPIIADTGVTVRRIAIDYKMGLSPEAIAQEIPHLSLAQVYSALAYYHANKDLIETDIAVQEAEAERLEAEYMAGKLQ
jgi:uncharacterized protein (DUF433 family)